MPPLLFLEIEMKYSVKVTYPTIAPMYGEDTFMFPNREEAEKFVAKASSVPNWQVCSPQSVIDSEVFCADAAFNWIVDEIAACNQLAF